MLALFLHRSCYENPCPRPNLDNGTYQISRIKMLARDKMIFPEKLIPCCAWSGGRGFGSKTMLTFWYQPPVSVFGHFLCRSPPTIWIIWSVFFFFPIFHLVWAWIACLNIQFKAFRQKFGKGIVKEQNECKNGRFRAPKRGNSCLGLPTQKFFAGGSQEWIFVVTHGGTAVGNSKSFLAR